MIWKLYHRCCFKFHKKKLVYLLLLETCQNRNDSIWNLKIHTNFKFGPLLYKTNSFKSLKMRVSRNNTVPAGLYKSIRSKYYLLKTTSRGLFHSPFYREKKSDSQQKLDGEAIANGSNASYMDQLYTKWARDPESVDAVSNEIALLHLRCVSDALCSPGTNIFRRSPILHGE